jgi:hypothetical protein
MQIVLLAIIVIALLYLSRYFPKVAFSVLGLLVLGASAIIFTSTDVARNAQSRVSSETVEIENPVMSPAYGRSYRFNARLKNTHESIALREIIVSITLLDCKTESETECATLGQTEQRIIVQIPPQQARDVSRTLSFDGADPLGTIRWQFKVTHTRS